MMDKTVKGGVLLLSIYMLLYAFTPIFDPYPMLRKMAGIVGIIFFLMLFVNIIIKKNCTDDVL